MLKDDLFYWSWEKMVLKIVEQMLNCHNTGQRLKLAVFSMKSYDKIGKEIKYHTQTYNQTIYVCVFYSAPAGSKQKAIEVRENFFKKHTPVSFALGVELKARTKSMSSVEKSEYYKSKQFSDKMQDCIDEIAALNVADLNKKLGDEL